MRLIDADSIPWDVDGVGEIPVITKEEINAVPTVDAVPIRHGKWIYGVGMLAYACFCSECKLVTHVERAEHYNYCPNCGADMREVEHETD